MSSSQNNPQSVDAALGGSNPSPNQGAILGGVDGVRQKLSHADLNLRLEAVDLAWNYAVNGGDNAEAGLRCLEEALDDRSKTVRRRARWLLRQSVGASGALPLPQPVWTLKDRLSAGIYTYTTEFAGYSVHEFELGQALFDPLPLAYALRCDYDHDDMSDRLTALLDLVGDRVEALVFGVWGDGEGVCTGDCSADGLIDLIVQQRDRLPNLKALLIGDITPEETEISWLAQGDMSPILRAYPQLEFLQIRGGTGLKFEASAPEMMHENLKALIIETGGLSRDTVHQIYEWDLPALEHLELWFGSENYGGDCWDRDLPPLLEEMIYPNLIYLGLRNSQFANEMIDMLVRSPLVEKLQVLDLSMGTLTDEAAVGLLDCMAIRTLDTLNVSENYLSGGMIDQLRSGGIEVLADEQRVEDDYDDPAYRRYCVISE
jgi:hypothetical protein